MRVLMTFFQIVITFGTNALTGGQWILLAPGDQQRCWVS